MSPYIDLHTSNIRFGLNRQFLAVFSKCGTSDTKYMFLVVSKGF